MSGHYRTGSYETWDFIEDLGLDFLEGNVVKYLTRAGRKGDRASDLAKAADYLKQLDERREAIDRTKRYIAEQEIDPYLAFVIELVVQRRYGMARLALEGNR